MSKAVFQVEISVVVVAVDCLSTRKINLASAPKSKRKKLRSQSLI